MCMSWLLLILILSMQGSAMKFRWEDDIRNDVKKWEIKNLTNRIQDRNKWKLYVEKAKTFKD